MPSTVFPQFGIRKIIVGLPQREIQEDKPATWFTSVGCTVQEGSQERRVACSIFRIKVLLLSSPTSLIGDPRVFLFLFLFSVKTWDGTQAVPYRRMIERK